MRRIWFLFLAACSLLMAAGEAPAATRPHYGGTLRVAVESAPNALEVPANATSADYWAMTRVLALIGDTLVKVDAQDHPQSALATAWQSDSPARHWQFTLRRGVHFHDGSALTAGSVAQILSELHPEWTVRGVGESLAIESDHSMPSLLAELALPQNAILKRNADGIPIGTGAFRVAEFDPGKSLKLAASDECWSGRPFVDAVEIEFGKALRDQSIALELGRADVVEAAPHTTASSNVSPRVRTSLSVELMALVFPAGSRAQDAHAREALALAIDRKPIQSVLFKGAADPAASLLPNWMTGYSSVFSARADPTRARALASDSHPPALTLSYDARDPQAQLIAERIALNARDAGLTLQVSLSGPDDIRLVRIVLPSPDPATSFREATRELGLPQPAVRSNAVDDLYQAERTLLDGHSVIPLFHLPVASGVSGRVRHWQSGRFGDWDLPDLWLEADSR
jgi:peptide/nickel transport system substrate-binding protein